jgi:poly-gamma-glutamate synthesis protein (capsule biosynthesis protein)
MKKGFIFLASVFFLQYIFSNACIALPQTAPKTEVITLSFVGDCTLGTDEDFTWNTFDEVYKKVNDPGYFFQGVKSIFQQDDFTLANLEGALTTSVEMVEKEYNYKGDPSYAEILVRGGVDAVTLANNHTLDFGEAGFQDTIHALNRYNIAYTHYETVIIKEIKGVKIAFLGYTGWGYDYHVRMLLDKQVKDLRAAGVDYIVANFHWGEMRSYEPNSNQKKMAYYAVDHGVDLVVGHHPHVLQGIEVYKGKNIVYSLGNFCYGGSTISRDPDTMIYQQILHVDPFSGTIVDLEHRVIPALVTATPEKNSYQPVLATGPVRTRILAKMSRLNGLALPLPYLPDMKLPGRNRQTAEGVLCTLK